ncbi:phage holin [Haloglycomyces albus]|uniref:phage holin n=1 Tax=Haloglycomyces albus TaxID=526067 RepID=UPI00046D6145|nr:hypothetical protein [Haloglycomyces albus]
MSLLTSPSVRRYLYGISGPLSGLLVSYGIISESNAGLWMGVVGAVLAVGSNGLAAAHTKPDDS